MLRFGPAAISVKTQLSLVKKRICIFEHRTQSGQYGNPKPQDSQLDSTRAGAISTKGFVVPDGSQWSKRPEARKPSVREVGRAKQNGCFGHQIESAIVFATVATPPRRVIFHRFVERGRRPDLREASPGRARPVGNLIAI